MPYYCEVFSRALCQHGMCHCLYLRQKQKRKLVTNNDQKRNILLFVWNSKQKVLILHPL